MTQGWVTTVAVAVALMGGLPPRLAAQSDSAAIGSGIDARADRYAEVARQIWNFAEVGYQEERSSALLQSVLGEAGFTIERGVADMPTAFVATWGSGAPVIGILGEYDALPGLSQAAVPVRQPLVEGGPGHGCGHHLFGTASAAAAIAVKDWLVASGRRGTVRFYGTPAEEGGSGKVYMVRAGLFSDVDAVLAWHPGDRHQVDTATSLANITGKFRFRGIAAHAAAAPERGRSALDGVEAMNHMVNLMREHVPSDARIHYVITSGGQAPNVVPDFAEVYYYARHVDRKVLDGIWERVVQAANGAALGTGTTVDLEVTGAVWNLLPNDTLSAVQQRSLEQVGGYRYTPEELAFATALQTTLDAGNRPALDLVETVQPLTRGARGGGSTDVGDVSWMVPTVQLRTATYVPGTAAHSWQAVAAGGTSIGTRGMLVAAKAMALTAAALYQSPAILTQARREFEEKRGPAFTYVTKLGDRKPALDYRK